MVRDTWNVERASQSMHSNPPSIKVTIPFRVLTLGQEGFKHMIVVSHVRVRHDLFVPISGTASDVVGIFSATRLRNTVNERRMVTPEIRFWILKVFSS